MEIRFAAPRDIPGMIELLKQVGQYARKENFDRITLNVWAFNESVLRFYEKLGMKPQKIGMEIPMEKETC